VASESDAVKMDKEKKYNLVYFEISGFCNARCPWCVTGNKSLNQVSYPSRFINVNDFRNAIAALLGGGLIYPRETLIRLDNWGEPMLHPELTEILKILRNNDVNFALSTNASKFVSLENDVLGNLQEMRFSVPGFSQSSYDRIHGFNFESILKNIEMFCKNIRKEGSTATLRMAYHLYQFNLDEIDAAMKFCSLNGIEFFPYSAYLNDFNLAKAYLNKSISTELLGRIGKDFFLHYVDELIARTPQDYQCPQFNILTIDEYCNVLTCCVLPKDHPEYSLGNLFTLSSDDIRKGKLSQKVCIECVKLGISYWVNNPPLVPGFMNTYESRLAELNHTLQEKGAQISSLETSLQEKGAQISSLETSLQEKGAQIHSLEFQRQQIQHSIPMQLVSRYQRIVERLLRSGTRRCYYYELGLTGIRVILNEGWKSFFSQVRHKLTHRRAAIKKARHDLPKSNASISKKEANKLVFPVPSEKPEVSIVIPVYNKWQYTLNCLKSIAENTEDDYEVVVVDDASTDATAEVLSKVKNLHLVTNKQNAGFIESCDRGARASEGKYILFLNNDTMVTKGWLPPLLEVIKREDVGAVGSKLVYPDGTLQEAGGIIWNDGSGWNYGRGDDPEKPEYNYVREVDYCSGASLMVKGELFEKIGGFDGRFRPIYYDDSDLCFSIRNLGYRVMYQPMSVIVHFEGVTCGTDTLVGIKKYQEINKPKFVEKWSQVLQKHHYPPVAENAFLARDRVSEKRILVIDHYVPTYDKDAGSFDMFSMLKILVELGNKVTFIGDNLLRLEPYTQGLQQKGIEVIYTPYVFSAEAYIKKYGRFLDVVILSRAHVAIKHLDRVKQDCIRAKVVYDTIDLQFLRKSRRASIENNVKLLKQAEELKATELYLARNSDITFVVSPVEKEILLKEDPSLNVEVIIRSVHSVKSPEKQFSERKDILFIGGFDHPPNVDAVIYFVKEILPFVKQRISDVRFYTVGSNPPKQVLSLQSDAVVVTGYVKDVTPYFENCKVFVAPLRYGAGVKGKILLSMSYGVPIVTTSIGSEGIGLVDGQNVLIADDPQEFVQKVILLCNEEELWSKLSRNSLEHIRRCFSYEVAKEQFKNLMKNL